MENEAVLDAVQWQREAEDHIKDVGNHVKDASVSKKLSSSDSGVHLNIKTLEDAELCVKLSASGLRVVGHGFDDTSLEEKSEQCFETIHALLDSLSPKYRESFGKELLAKLQALQKETSLLD